jgi:hypothetical protein
MHPDRTERERFWATVRAIVAVTLLACQCGAPNPPVDGCMNPSEGGVDAVELSATRLLATGSGFDLADDDAPPRPLVDGDSVRPVSGSQGARMIALRLVLRGPSVPECISQETQAEVNGVMVARNREPLATFPLEDGSRATHTLWLPGAYEAEATLSTVAAGRRASVRVLTGDSCAAHCPCAQAIGTDEERWGATLSDAGHALWSALWACRARACGDAGFDAGSCRDVFTSDGGCGAEYAACAADSL